MPAASKRRQQATITVFLLVVALFGFYSRAYSRQKRELDRRSTTTIQKDSKSSLNQLSKHTRPATSPT